MATQILTQFGVPAEDLSHGERFLRGAFAGYVSTSDPDVPKNWFCTPRNHPKTNGSSLLIVAFLWSPDFDHIPSSVWDTCGFLCQEILLFAHMSFAEASAMAWWIQLRKEGAWPKAHSALHGLGDSGRLERKWI